MPDQPHQQTPSDLDEVSDVTVPEQPPMLDDDDQTAGTSTDDLSVQGGE